MSHWIHGAVFGMGLTVLVMHLVRAFRKGVPVQDSCRHLNVYGHEGGAWCESCGKQVGVSMYPKSTIFTFPLKSNIPPAASDAGDNDAIGAARKDKEC